MKPILTYITCKNEQEARRIAKTIVKEKLASCANIVSPIESIYTWKGKLQQEKETLLLLKTFDTHFKRIEQMIKKIHSYDTPCIIAVPIAHAEKTYLAWSEEAVL